MGYFSNSTEGELYRERYCYKCVHYHNDYECPCWEAHELWNYEECNKEDSVLHKIIPRKGTVNDECVFYNQVHIDKYKIDYGTY